MNQLDLDAKKQAARELARRQRATGAPISDAMMHSIAAPRGGIVDRNDCTVRALHMATRMSYAEAHAHMERFGRVVGKGPSWSKCHAAYIEAGALRHVPLGGKTLHQALQTVCARGIWIIATRGHVSTWVDGKLVSDAFPSGKRTRVPYGEGAWQFAE